MLQTAVFGAVGIIRLQKLSRFGLGNRLLYEIYNEKKQKFFSTVKYETVNLSIDGWYNVHIIPIFCSYDTTKLENIDTSGKPHTADYPTELSKVIRKKRNKEF